MQSASDSACQSTPPTPSAQDQPAGAPQPITMQPGTGFSGKKCRSHTGTGELKFTTEKYVVTSLSCVRQESWITEKVANAEVGRTTKATVARTSKLFFIAVFSSLSGGCNAFGSVKRIL